MLLDLIKKTLKSSKRNKFSFLIKEIYKCEKLTKEFNYLKENNISDKRNLYNILNNTRNPICPVCNINHLKWVEKDFKYRTTCSSKCSGKLPYISKKLNIKTKYEGKYIRPEIKNKSHLIELLHSNKIKSNTIKHYKEYYDIISNYKGNSFKEKLYRYCNEISDDIIVLCLNCSNKKTKFINFSIGYRTYCSVKCSSNSEIKKKMISETILEKHGVKNISQSKYKLQPVINKYNKILNSIEPNEYDILSLNSSKFKINHKSCDNIFEIDVSILSDRIRTKCKNYCTICNPINSMTSSQEIEILKYLKDKYNNEIIKNNRSVLVGKELDIYIPDLNIAIEINGIYWHSEKHKSKNYHLEKTLKCKEKGIELIHIFEDDWMNKKEIVESILLNKINKIPNKIYARKCVIKEVSVKDTREFLDKNHIQGFSRSKYKLGLYYNDELVSLMTFGYRKTNSKKEFELIRFCNILNTTVVGAVSKLFKCFIKNYSDKIEEDCILSYNDVSMFTGDLYNSLGFNYIHRSKPNYFWVVDGKREHKWKYNKQNLIKEGFNSGLTEVEIIHQRGYYRIYGCGQDRYEYRIK